MIRPFLEPVRALSGSDGRWLLLGKGPSFARLADCDPEGRRICTLNHAIQEQPADLAHIADLDVVDQCGDALARNARLLVMPWRPHGAEFEASSVTLAALAEDHPVLGPLAAEGRLLCYNLSTGRGLPPHPQAPWIEADLFSGAVVAELLTLAGARELRTLGVDGGGRYAASFRELEEVTLLSHGAPSFDSQFARFAALGWQHDLTWGPLYAQTPLHAVIAASPTDQLAAAVLAHGLSRRTGTQVSAEVLDPAQMAVAPADLAARSKGAGRVLRLDPDLIAIDTLLPFWSADMGGAASLTDATGGAVLIDAAHPAWAAGEGPPTQSDPSFTPFARFEGPERPWRENTAGPIATLWSEDLRDGLTVGSIPLDQPREAIRAGHVTMELTKALELDHDTARGALDDPALWNETLSDALFLAARRRLPKPPQPRGWRSWPGRLARKTARWWDARLGIAQTTGTPRSKT